MPNIWVDGVIREMTEAEIKAWENALAVEPGLCWVETLYGNEPAKRLYESFGFTVREIVAGKMPGNEQFAVRVYRMYRDVSKLC